MERIFAGRVHPLTSLWSMVVGVIAIYAAPPWWLVFWSVAIVAIYLRYGKRRMRGLLQALLAGSVLGFLHVLNHEPGAPYAFLAVTSGVRFGLVILGVAALLGSGSLMTMLAALEHGLKRIFGRRETIGYGILMMVLALFFLPYMVQDVRVVRQDQAMRQYLGNTRQWRPLHFLRPILAQGLLASDSIAESLWSRGWRPAGIPATTRGRWLDLVVIIGWLTIIGVEVARWPK